MIIINNEDALRVECEDVLPEEVGPLVAQLESELNNANRLGKRGIGLAAPQIGIAKKIAIVRMGGDNNLDLVNCTVTKGWDLSTFEGEGCLSFPGRVEKTKRFQEVLIEGNFTKPNRMIATGMFAVAIQHETEHYNKILFIDHVVQEKLKKVRPNDPCTCGTLNLQTGKPFKFKKCCGKK